MTQLLILTLLVLFLVVFFGQMVWLVRARNKAQAASRRDDDDEPIVATHAWEEVERVEDGLVLGHQHLPEHEIVAPDASGGEFGGVRALQGRR